MHVQRGRDQARLPTPASDDSLLPTSAGAAGPHDDEPEQFAFDSSLDGLLSDFEAACRSDAPPTLEEYWARVTLAGVADSVDQQRALLQEMIALDLEYRWKRKVPTLLDDETLLGGDATAIPRLEDYRTLLESQFGPMPEWPVSLILDECRIQQRYAELPDPSEYQQRFPDIPGLSQALRKLNATPAAAAPPAVMDIRPLADYELVREIARGGMGVVYQARQKSLKRTVAIKMILAGQLASDDAVRRFYAEAQAAAGLNHPHIVPVFEVGQDAGRHFFSMGYVDGQSLSARVAKDGPLPPAEAAHLVETISQAVDYAHQQGVVHRDLKPQNVLLTKDGRPLVTDFGLAKQMGEVDGFTVSGQLVGTPSFMSPEQAQGRLEDVGPLSDVYALGAVLYHLLTGRPPFHTASMLETLKQVIERDPLSPRSLNPEVNKDLETICLKCLQKDAAKRYASARHVADDLQRFLDGRDILARPISSAEKALRWCRRRPSTAALITLTAAVLLVGVPGAVWYQAQLAASQLAAQLADSRRWAAEERASASQQVADANQRVATTQEYHATVNDVRQAISLNGGQIGWTRDALVKLKDAAALDTPARNAAELRSEAISCLTSYDVQLRTEVAKGMQAGQVAFSADGQWLAVGQSKAQLFAFCTVLVIDAESGETAHRLTFAGGLILKEGKPVQDGCRQLAFSPDRRWLACGTRSGYVQAWDLKQTPPQHYSWRAHGQEIQSMLFAPESTRLYTACEAEKSIKLWPLAGEIGKEAGQHLALHGINGISWHPRDGYVLVDEDEGQTTRLSSDTLGPLESRTLPLRGSAYCAPLHRSILVGGQGRLEMLAGLDQAAVLRTYVDPANSSRHLGSITQAAFSQDSQLMLTVHRGDRLATVWETASGRIVANTGFEPEAMVAAALDPRGGRLAVAASPGVLLYEITANLAQSIFSHHHDLVQAMAWGPRRAEGITEAHDPPWIKQFPYRDAGLVTVLGNATAIASHAATARAAAYYVDVPRVDIWDLSKVNHRVASLSVPRATCLCFTPDGRRLWGISEGLKVWSWTQGANDYEVRLNNQLQDMLTGRSSLLGLAAGDDFVLVGTRLGELLSLSDHADVPQRWAVSEAPLLSVALAPAQDVAVCGAENGDVLLVSLRDGSVLKRLARHKDDVSSVAFTSDGRYLASASLDRTVRIWRRDGSAIEELLVWRLPAAALEVCFHPDNRTLAIRAQGELGIRVLELDRLHASLAEIGLGWTAPELESR